MAQSKHEFFRKGIAKQKRPDIIIDFRRVDVGEIKKWTDDEREPLEHFIKTAEKSFKAFKEAILSKKTV